MKRHAAITTLMTLALAASMAPAWTTDAAHQLTVTIVNSDLNSTKASDIERQAIGLAFALQRGIAAKPEFQGVASIHVDYIDREGEKTKVIQLFDFFRSPANVFVLRKT